MKKILICNQKGGSGKTIFSSLLIKTLSHLGKNVLVIDLDPQGGLSSLLLDRGNYKGLYEFLSKEDLHSCIHPVINNIYSGSISIIPSDYRTDKLFLSTSPFALKPLASLKYDYCIIDTPPTVQGITKAGMILSDRVIIPTEISVQSKSPTQYTIESILEVEKKPEVVLSGWKEVGDRGGYQNNLIREFETDFKKYITGHISRNTSLTSFATEWKKASSSILEKIIEPISKIIG